MKAVKTPPLKYEILRELLPLDTPMTVLVDPANACNFRCTFCPTGDPDLLKSVNRPLGVMKFSLFQKIVDDLAEFPGKIKTLNLHKDGEPLINKRLGDMISYAKKRDVAQTVWVTTNAALLSKDRAVEIIEAGLDCIRISVEHVHDEGYLAIAQNYSDYECVRRNVEFLYQEKEKRGSRLKVYSKIVDVDLKEEERQKYLDDFSPICDYVNIDALMGWSSTGGADMMLGKSPETAMDGVTGLRNRMVCPSPFKTMAINFNGKVSVCCVDWSLDTIVGDASEEHVVSIWNGETLREFRMTHLCGGRETLKACKDCQYVQGYTSESDLDDDRERLLPLFS